MMVFASKTVISAWAPAKSRPFFSKILDLFNKKIIIKNKTKPSKKASYNWLGCLGNLPPLGNIIPKWWLVTLPKSSPFIKFAILPKKRPIGETIEIKSEKIIVSFVGPLQTNKSEDVVNKFHEVQSLDRIKLVKSLSKAESKLNKRLNYMVQVNTGNEEQKSGINPNEVDDFIKLCKINHGLNVTGLMCIPPINQNPAIHFAFMSEIYKRNNLKHLSMGMSNDYKTAIEFGATHIRIGSKLFGERLEKEEK